MLWPHALSARPRSGLYLLAMNERDAKFFRPLWLRVGLTIVVGGWFLFETFLSQDQLWMVITGIAFGYCIYSFFLTFPKNLPAPPADKPPTQPGG